MKRLLCITLACICILIPSITPASAVDVVYDISYWYSDASEIGYWANKNINVYVTSQSTYSSLTTTQIRSYLATAKNSWYCTKARFNYVSQESNANITVSGITRAAANNLGFAPNTAGIALITHSGKIGTLMYGASEKGLDRIRSAKVYLIQSQATSTNAGAKAVAVHEIGHALGYFGHYNSGNIMTTYYENITSVVPSTNERNHLAQIN